MEPQSDPKHRTINEEEEDGVVGVLEQKTKRKMSTHMLLYGMDPLMCMRNRRTDD